MEKDIFVLGAAEKSRKELSVLSELQQRVEEKYGLALSENQLIALQQARNESLRKYQRVEFGRGILDKLIFTFCDSQYIFQDNYEEVLEELQDIFYLFKNESQDKLTDDELLVFMREQYETVCCGDTEYLESTCLERFSLAVRAGYEGSRESGGSGEYEQFSEEQRWDSELYQRALKTLFWE